MVVKTSQSQQCCFASQDQRTTAAADVGTEYAMVIHGSDSFLLVRRLGLLELEKQCS